MLDPLIIFLLILVFAIYGTICLISIFFTFFLDTYRQVDQLLRKEIIPARVLLSLERNIDWLDTWLFNHNKLVGPLLILLSMVDLKLSINIINQL